MMKKYIGFFLLIFFFSINNTLAANYCELQDESKWVYQETALESEASRLVEEKGYDHYFCCSDSSQTRLCDFYTAVSTSEGSNQNTNTESGTNTNNTNYCSGLKSTFMIIGHVVRLAKILIPIVIIGFGMMDFFKAVVGSKDDEIKKSIKSLIMRCLAGVCIFFLPAFIDLIFSWVDGWENNYQSGYEDCFKCIWDVGSCTNS